MGSTNDLLPFQRNLIEQILEEDSLCVLAPGLGLHQLVAVLLRLQDVRVQTAEQRGTVIIIGASPLQRKALRQELLRIHPQQDRTQNEERPGNESVDLPAEVTADIATTERLRLYRSCSSLFVTTRILVVDLLSGRLSPADVAGIIVLNAHRVTDSSGEGFAVRLYRSGNASGFVRGFSDVPISFSSEFGKAEKILRALFAKRLHLWPRFQVSVQDDLESSPPELVEISLPSDPGAALIYEALSELIDGCIKELRRHEQLDTTDLTPSQGLSSSFDETVRRQLASVWHTVSPRTRQIVADMRTLRSLAVFLNKLDPVTFLTYLETLRATEGTKCAWLFHSAAHTVFETAKGRVYQLQQSKNDPNKRKNGNTTKAGAGAIPSIQPVLEELPKWHALLEILEEVRKEQEDRIKAAGFVVLNDTTTVADTKPPPTLVFCSDEYTCNQLRDVVGPDGPSGMMRRIYRDYLQYKMDSSVDRRGAASVAGSSGIDAAPAAPRMMGGYVPGEEDALIKEAKELGATKPKKAAGKRKGRAVNAPRKRGEKAALAAATAPLMAIRKTLTTDSAPQQKEFNEATTKAAKEDNHDVMESSKSPTRGDLGNPEGVVFVALDVQGSLPLWQYQPQFVIVCDPDVALTRSLEVFKAQRRTQPLRVYLLRYEDSPEMDKYQSAVVRERDAFENLIRAKGIMAPPPAQGISNAIQPAVGPEDLPQGVAGNAITRRAGGRLGGKSERIRIIVDVREFMSPLPAVLHAKGLQIIPLTLEVGDYVLSPEICVERKSLNDLRGSLQSGRLYQQAEAMCKHYKTAILLIEFDGDRAFALQGACELGDDIQAGALMSRLVLLCLHHPRLRLVWSRSLHATADIFKQLKQNHEEPDPVVAANMGVSHEDTVGRGGETVVNSAAIDMLRRLPGVNESNWRALMREAGSLKGLSRLPLDRLVTVMGGEVPAKKLYEFLSQECRALFKSL